MNDDYISGNKAAWEEAFDMRSTDWGKDIVTRVESEAFPFFNEEVAEVLATWDTKGKTVAQFCCNNGRETLSLVKSGKAARGFGFDIAENQISFAKDCAKKLDLPCEFVATNIYDISGYDDMFDFVIITIGALCWFKDIDGFFGIVSKSMKKGAKILINESHPMLNMLATEGDEGYDKNNPFAFVFSYFDHEWKNNYGMEYIAGKTYQSKTFTDYTHPLSEIMGAMCKHGIVITNFKEYQHDIGIGCEELDDKGFPLSMIIEGKKL